MKGRKAGAGTKKARGDRAPKEQAFHAREERLTAGNALRTHVPRQSHGAWKRPPKSRDPIDILKRSNAGRLQELVPIRFGRMLRSPFTFLRGSAGLMAYDLAKMP